MSEAIERWDEISKAYGIASYEYANHDEEMPESEDDEWAARLDAIEEKFTSADWRELAARPYIAPARVMYAEKARKAEKREKAAALAAAQAAGVQP
jgi:hypothetical protein